MVSVALVCCGQRGEPVQDEESVEAKRMLQGVWSDADTETLVFKMDGDSVYYPDSTSMPAYFKVVGDTLYVGSSARYHIERHTDNLLWFQAPDGELVKLVRNTETASEKVFEENRAQILTLTSVVKRDTVVYYDARRYHLYIAVNPTKYQVKRHTLNEDGLDVENVYYDNIIHVSIFEGNRQLFSRDFRKQLYQGCLSAPVLSQCILNNMEYARTDAKGFHFSASLCIPDDASCYLVEHVITFDGKLSTLLQEY